MGFGSTPCRGTLFKTNIREKKKIIRTRKPFILSTGYILKREGGNVLFSPYESVTPVNVREKSCNYEVGKVERQEEMWPKSDKTNLCLDLYFIRKC